MDFSAIKVGFMSSAYFDDCTRTFQHPWKNKLPRTVSYSITLFSPLFFMQSLQIRVLLPDEPCCHVIKNTMILKWIKLTLCYVSRNNGETIQLVITIYECRMCLRYHLITATLLHLRGLRRHTRLQKKYITSSDKPSKVSGSRNS